MAPGKYYCVIGYHSSSHTYKGAKREHGLQFFRIPRVKRHYGKFMEGLTTRRRRAWIAAIRRSNITFEHSGESARVCSKHFHGATKCVGAEDILVWSLDDTLSSGGFRKRVKVGQPLLRLVYPEMREKHISIGYASGVLSLSSDNGTFYLYDVEDMTYAITSPVSIPMKPSAVLEWPEAEGLDDDDNSRGDVVLNMVVMSSDRNVVAAGTDSNLVCIWHRT